MEKTRRIVIAGWGSCSQKWAAHLGLPSSQTLCLDWSDETLDASASPLLARLTSSEEQVTLLGWSLGGLLSLRAAALCPEKVRNVVLVAGTPRMTADGSFPGVDPRQIQIMRRRLPRNRQATMTSFAELSASASPAKEGFAEWFVPQTELFTTEQLVHGLELLLQLDIIELLPQITAPVQLLHGEEDNVIPCEVAHVLLERLANASLCSLPQVGHDLAWQCPDLVREQIITPEPHNA